MPDSSDRYFFTTTIWARKSTDDPMSSASPAKMTRSKFGAALSGQSNWGSGQCRAATRQRIRKCPGAQKLGERAQLYSGRQYRAKDMPCRVVKTRQMPAPVSG